MQFYSVDFYRGRIIMGARKLAHETSGQKPSEPRSTKKSKTHGRRSLPAPVVERMQKFEDDESGTFRNFVQGLGHRKESMEKLSFQALKGELRLPETTPRTIELAGQFLTNRVPGVSYGASRWLLWLAERNGEHIKQIGTFLVKAAASNRDINTRANSIRCLPYLLPARLARTTEKIQTIIEESLGSDSDTIRFSAVEAAGKLAIKDREYGCRFLPHIVERALADKSYDIRKRALEVLQKHARDNPVSDQLTGYFGALQALLLEPSNLETRKLLVQIVENAPQSELEEIAAEIDAFIKSPLFKQVERSRIAEERCLPFLEEMRETISLIAKAYDAAKLSHADGQKPRRPKASLQIKPHDSDDNYEELKWLTRKAEEGSYCAPSSFYPVTRVCRNAAIAKTLVRAMGDGLHISAFVNQIVNCPSSTQDSRKMKEHYSSMIVAALGSEANRGETIKTLQWTLQDGNPELSDYAATIVSKAKQQGIDISELVLDFVLKKLKDMQVKDRKWEIEGEIKGVIEGANSEIVKGAVERYKQSEFYRRMSSQTRWNLHNCLARRQE